MLVTREKAIQAAEQFLSGFARYTETYFGEGTAAKILDIDPNITLDEFADIKQDEGYSDPTDFGQFEFVALIADVYDYAATGYCSYQSPGERLSDLQPFWEVFKESTINLMDAYANFFIEITIDEKPILDILWDVSNTAMARMKLPGGEDWDDLTLAEVASLAGISVKAVRNAANNKGPNQLRITKKGSSVIVNPEDALIWLRRRGDFKEYKPYDDGPIPVQSYENIEEFILNIHAICQTKDLNIQEAFPEIKLDKHHAVSMPSLENGTVGFEVSGVSATQLYEFAVKVNVDDPSVFAIEGMKVIGAFNAVEKAKSELSLTNKGVKEDE